jgi:hypothetical protein
MGNTRPAIYFYGKHTQLFFFNVAISANYFPNVSNYHWQQTMLIPRQTNRGFPSFAQQTAYKTGR